MREARQRGICAEGYGFMRGCDRDQLVDYYVANPDWCMEQMFPSLDFLHSEFSDCEDKGVNSRIRTAHLPCQRPS